MSILPPPEFFEICGQLLRYCEKINPQRIKDTPPVNFFLCLVLASPISKKDFYKKQSLAYQKRHGCRRFQAAASFSSEKLVVGQRTRTYAVQHACGCFLYAPSIYSAYLQKGRLHLANSTTFLQTINYLIKHGKRYSVLYTKMSFSDWDSPIQTKLNPSLRKTGFLGA